MHLSHQTLLEIALILRDAFVNMPLIIAGRIPSQARTVKYNGYAK